MKTFSSRGDIQRGIVAIGFSCLVFFEVTGVDTGFQILEKVSE